MLTNAQITPCLWFDGNAEAAVDFYLSVFDTSRIVSTVYYGEAGPGPAESVLTITFELRGQRFIALNGGPEFKFTEAISLLVPCDSQAEIDVLWDRLVEGGSPQQCGWLKDRFGLSWQIVPAALEQMLQDPDPAKCSRVMQAVLQMVKPDIAALERAYRQ